MPNTINGTGKPVFTKAITPDGVELRMNIEFPYCNIGGVQNEVLQDSQVIELESGRLEQDIFGYRNKFILDYSQKLDGDYCLELQTLLNLRKSGHRLFCKPMGVIEYEIIFSNASYLLSLLPSAGTFVSMRGIVIEMLCVELDSINWQVTYEAGDPVYTSLDDFVIVGNP